MIVDFSNAFDSIRRGMMEQILIAYGLLKETIMMLNRNTNLKVHSLDGETDIVAEVLHGDNLAPYQFMICLDYIIQMSIDHIKENGFILKKARSRRYPAETTTDADNADNIMLHANISTQTEFLPISLEQAAGGLDLHENASKMEYISFN